MNELARELDSGLQSDIYLQSMILNKSRAFADPGILARLHAGDWPHLANALRACRPHSGLSALQLAGLAAALLSFKGDLFECCSLFLAQIDAN